MSMFLIGLLMAQAATLPQIDRRALELEARAEALGATRASAPAVRHTHVVPAPAARAAANRTSPTRAAAPAQRRSTASAVRPANLGSELDLSAITSICRAAGSQPDPAGFLATLSRAYSMSADRSAQLRTSCAAYLAGRADARTRD